jgi:hypothetical protein
MSFFDPTINGKYIRNVTGRTTPPICRFQLNPILEAEEEIPMHEVLCQSGGLVLSSVAKLVHLCGEDVGFLVTEQNIQYPVKSLVLTWEGAGVG